MSSVRAQSELCHDAVAWSGGLTLDAWRLAEEGGDSEIQGNVTYTFTRPDGTQLGTQGTVLA